MSRIALPIACRVDGASLMDGRSLLEDLQPAISGDGLGSNLLTNGTFDSDTAWTKGAGWSIAGGVAVRIPDASTSGLSQAAAFVAGRTYRVTFTVSGFAAGQFLAQFTGGTTRSGTARTANGTYVEDLLANTGNVSFRIFATGVTNGIIDNVSVREVL